MADEPQPKSDTVLMKNFFGYRDGEGLSDFSNELKTLSPEEKAELGEGIRNGTFTY